MDCPADHRGLSLGYCTAISATGSGSIYGAVFQARVKNLGIEEVKIAPRNPWQNPYCERVIGSIRRDALDHVIVLNERIYAVYFNLMSSTTTIGGRIDHWRWMHRNHGPFNHRTWARSRSFRKSAVCIIIMSDEQLE